MTMQMDEFSSPAVRESSGYPTRPLFLQLDCSSSGPGLETGLLGFRVGVDGKLLLFLVVPIV